MTPVIVIDPGHGGQDDGATWPLVRFYDTLDLVEKSITSLVGGLLQRSLREEGVACEITRDDDEDLSLAARGALAEKHGADLVISIHVNSSPDPDAQGMMTFARHGDVVGTRVAQVIAANAPEPFRRKRNAYFECRKQETDPDREWLQRASNVLHAFSGVPTVLVELFHLTNAADRMEWDAEGAPEGCVHAMLMGVDCFLMLNKVPVPVGRGGRPFLL